MDGAPLPHTGPIREKLRAKGQFWTPDWVADAMVTWATAHASQMFDPAVGSGAFFRAAERCALRFGRDLTLSGCELDPSVLDQVDRRYVTVTDFMEQHGLRHPAIVANPPYVRHHRFTPDYKAMLRAFGTEVTGTALDGRAGLHVFFLIKALTSLAEGGRLALIVPADVCEGRFAAPLWQWIGRTYRIEAAVTFASIASPFPGVDTNPLILLLSRVPPTQTLIWARVLATGPGLLDWCSAGLPSTNTNALYAVERDTDEGLTTGLSRPPQQEDTCSTIPLGRLFRVMRGIATGDNSFFFMTTARARALKLPPAFMLRAIGRTRDHTEGARLTLSHLDALDRQKRPTQLLSVGRTPMASLPEAVQAYLRTGEAMGLPQRPLIAQRKPWYRMEVRPPPPWLFAYLGRRTCRFIHNEAGAMPLTGFLCVYPQYEGMEPAAVTAALNDPRTLANLHRVAKSYGGGALKVEPRNLERLSIPIAVLHDHGIPTPPQLTLV